MRFVWKDPDTGREFEDQNKQSLIDRVTAYRRQNNLEEIEELGVVMESYWCGLPENKGKCVGAELERGWLGYVRGGLAMVRNLVYKAFAPQGVADARSRQCSGCKFNVFPDRGPFIEWSDKIAEASTLGRRSEFHDELGSCAVCTCPLRAKVFIGDVIPLEPEWIPDMQSVMCWQLAAGKVVKKN